MQTTNLVEIVRQVDRFPDRMQGARGSDLVQGYDLAVEVLGERAAVSGSDLPAFAYLWRRFGPPWWGSDGDKNLALYYLTTPDPDVYLSLGLGGSLAHSVGYMIVSGLDEMSRKSSTEWQERMDHWVRRNLPPGEDWWRFRFDRQNVDRAILEIGPPPAREPKDWRQGSPVRIRINEALSSSLRDLMRPVFIRDVGINILGLIHADDYVESVERSRYAGYRCPKEAMDQIVEAGD